MKRGDFFHTEQQKRILTIDRMLRLPGGRTRHQICEALSTMGFAASRHTFMRDIDHMRFELGAPIGYEDRRCDDAPRGHTTFWFYRDPSWTLKTFKLTEEALFGLFVAAEVVKRYAGHPLAEELKAAFDKLGESLNRKITVDADNFAALSILPEPTTELRADIWKPVLRATTRQKQLKMTYMARWKEGASKATTRTVHPYHIANLHGTWYLLGSRSQTDPALRQYAISGIRNPKVLKDSATIPDDFDINEILDITFGKFIGDPKQVVDITLRFKKDVVPLLENQCFSREEHRRSLPDGGLKLTFPVSTAGPWPLYHVKGWVLSWGPDCEVVEPPELKELVRNDIDAMQHAYNSEKKGQKQCRP